MADKVSLATYQLKGNARNWWRLIKPTLFPVPRIETWAEFKRAFMNKHFTDTMQDAKTREFMELTQGNMTVTQYENKFVELLKFVPAVTNNPVDQAKRFERGLRYDIRIRLSVLKIRDVHELYERVQLVEQDLNESKQMYQLRQQCQSQSYN